MIDRRVERAIAAMLRSFHQREAFGIDFPSTCPDGAGHDGTDEQAFQAALAGAVPDMEKWLTTAVGSDGDSEPQASTEDILDTLEWLAARVGQVEREEWHSYFRHHHLSWDRAPGRQAFREETNAIFARNGLAYEMDEDGRIRRVVEGSSPDVLARTRFTTGDSATDQLLESARRRFFDRDADAGQHSIELLWDAFERIKTLEDPSNKRNSANALIIKASKNESARSLLEEEMRTLTQIGNSWRIRHHEVGKTELGDDPELRDYLFLRMFDLIRLLLIQR